MKVLIAGASGYIGSRLSAYLADAGCEIIALCNKNVPIDKEWIGKMKLVLALDLSSTAVVNALEIEEIDVIINLVSLDHHQSNGNPDYVNAINVSSTWNLLEKFANKALKKYIYFSTIHVYGNALTGAINEQSATQPVNKYGLTHLLSEQVVNFYASTTNIECTNIRLSNGYGAPFFMHNKCWDLVVNNLCIGVWNNQEIILKSDGSPLRDFIHLSDVLKGVETLLLKPDIKQKHAEIINFSSQETISMLNTAMLVKEVYEEKYQKQAPVFINENQLVSNYAKNETSTYSLINSKLNCLLENQKLFSLRQGINEIFDFLDLNNESIS